MSSSVLGFSFGLLPYTVREDGGSINLTVSKVTGALGNFVVILEASTENSSESTAIGEEFMVICISNFQCLML